MKLTILLSGFLIAVMVVSAQPSIQWKKALGSSGDERPGLIQTTSDGGYIVVGNGAMNGGNITGNHGSGDIWIAKLDGNGNLVWQKSLGGSGIEEGRGIRQTPDGGYIVIGSTNTPNDGDVSGMHIFNSAGDAWVVKISSAGVIEWQHCYGGTDNDYGYSVTLTPDGGYLFGIQTRSSDGDIMGNPFNADHAWLIKTNSTGVIQWQSGISIAYMAYVESASDGGYIAACYANGIVPGGEVNCGLGNYDILLVKFSNTGIIQWQKCLGGSGQDFPGSVQQTTDGGYIVGGYTGSTDGNVIGQHGQTDAWIAKVSSTGVLEWQRCLGGTGNDFGFCARQTSDGGYVMAAELGSDDGDVTSFNGGFWVIKMNAMGIIQWQKNFGAPFLQLGDERPRWIEQTPDGGYIVDGTVHFSGGDVTGVNGGIDYWVVKLLCSGVPVTSGATDVHDISLNHSFSNQLCGAIASIIPSGGSPVTGSVTTKVTIDPAVIFYNNHYYVQRHYDIEPAVSAASATAMVTLYFTQQEFNNFNAANGGAPDLPTGPADMTGKSNLRILQFHGTGTGLGNYTGTGIGLDPDDNKIVWNAALSRWEVTFDVNGFSGFFITNGNGVTLPVDYVYFTGKKIDEGVQLKWKVENQVNNLRFEIERSNGQMFTKIGELPATSQLTEEYEWKDISPVKGKNLYRIKQIDWDGRSKFSTMLVIDFNKPSLALYPNPAKDRIFVDGLQEFRVAIFKDLTGRVISRRIILPGQQWLETGSLVPGMYFIELVKETDNRSVQKFVKE